jgi:predicted transcriptional regulator YdeE
MQVPAQSYLVFRITLGAGEIHPQMQAAMKYIFNEALPSIDYRPTRPAFLARTPGPVTPSGAGRQE